jgi:hypothetical protein
MTNHRRTFYGEFIYIYILCILHTDSILKKVFQDAITVDGCIHIFNHKSLIGFIA